MGISKTIVNTRNIDSLNEIPAGYFIQTYHQSGANHLVQNELTNYKGVSMWIRTHTPLNDDGTKGADIETGIKLYDDYIYFNKPLSLWNIWSGTCSINSSITLTARDRCPLYLVEVGLPYTNTNTGSISYNTRFVLCTRNRSDADGWVIAGSGTNYPQTSVSEIIIKVKLLFNSSNNQWTLQVCEADGYTNCVIKNVYTLPFYIP